MKKFYYVSANGCAFDNTLMPCELKHFPHKTYNTFEEAEIALQKHKDLCEQENAEYPDEQEDPEAFQIFEGVIVSDDGGE